MGRVEEGRGTQKNPRNILFKIFLKVKLA